MTLSSPLNIQQLELENITTLESQLQQRQNQETTGQKYIKKNVARDGDFWEYYVGLEAWKRDAEVFKNLGKSGEVDLVLVKDGETLLCDVKQKAQYRIYNSPPNYDYFQTGLNTVPDDVYMICVHPISLDIAWNTKRIPKGWEDFWK